MIKVKSFTLIELTVVIAIIAVLAAVVVPNAFKAIEKSKITRMTSDLDIIKKASFVHYTDTGQWPATIAPSGGIPGKDLYRGGMDQNYDPNGKGSNGSKGGAGTESSVRVSGNDLLKNASDSTGWDGPYLEKWPEPPWDSLAGYNVSNDTESEMFNSGSESTEIMIYISRFDYLDVAEKIDSQIDDGDIGAGTFRFNSDQRNPYVMYLIYRDGPLGKSS